LTNLSHAIRQKNFNLDNTLNIFFSNTGVAKEKIDYILKTIRQLTEDKNYKKRILKSLISPNKQKCNALHTIAYHQPADVFSDVVNLFDDVRTLRSAIGMRTQAQENLLSIIMRSNQAIEKLDILYKTLGMSQVNRMLLKKNFHGFSPFMQALREEKSRVVKYLLRKINTSSRLVQLIHDKKLTTYEQEYLAKLLVKNVAQKIFSSTTPKLSNESMKKIVSEYKSTFIREVINIAKTKYAGVWYLKTLRQQLKNNKQLDNVSNKQEKQINAILELIKLPKPEKSPHHFQQVFFKRRKKYNRNSFQGAIEEITTVLNCLDECEEDRISERSLTPRIFEFVS
jgi:hypothetical protein